MVQIGKMCRRCEPGFAPAEGVCRPVDSVAMDASTSAVIDASVLDVDALWVDPEACDAIAEVCGNAKDDDCDGVTDEHSDAESSCDGVDEDCDGIVDEGLIRTESRDLWPQRIEDPNFSQVRLLPNSNGGGWLLYRAGTTSNLQDESPRPVSVVGIAADGSRTTSVDAAQQALSAVTQFVAGGDSVYVATLSRDLPAEPNDRSQALNVRLFTARDMTLLGQARVDYRGDRNYGTYLAPLSVSLFEDRQGSVHILVAYEADTQAAGVWGDALKIAHIRRAASGHWSQPNQRTLFALPFGAASVAIERIPCRDEWLVATAAASGGADSRLAIYSPDGSGDRQLQLLGDVASIDGIGSYANDCASPVEMVVAHSPWEGKTTISRWMVTPDGRWSSEPSAITLASPLRGAALAPSGGAWIAAGADLDGSFMLYRTGFAAGREAEIVRVLEPGGPNPGILRDGEFSRVADLLPLGDVIYAVVANSFRESNLTSLLLAQPSGIGEAAALSLHIGCFTTP